MSEQPTNTTAPCSGQAITFEGDEAVALFRKIWLAGFRSGAGSAFMTINSDAGIPQPVLAGMGRAFGGLMHSRLDGDRLTIEAINHELQHIVAGTECGATAKPINLGPLMGGDK
jgi:hypothetical protein